MRKNRWEEEEVGRRRDGRMRKTRKKKRWEDEKEEVGRRKGGRMRKKRWEEEEVGRRIDGRMRKTRKNNLKVGG